MDTERVSAAMTTRWGAPLRWAHRGVTRGQLAGLAAYDRFAGPRRSEGERAAVAQRVTMAVKTFERPETVRRLVRSARRVFDGRIVIADDSRVPVAFDDPRVDVLPMPFNSGVSIGRNAALDAVTTEFVFVTDDDIVFTALSDIAGAVAYLDDNPEVDVVGMLRVEVPRWYAMSHGADGLYPGSRPPLRGFGELIDGLPVQVKLEQLYLARTASIQRVRWNENIRMVDHNDFFSRASGVLVCVLDPGMRAYHARTPFNAFYTQHREDVDPDLAYLAQAWDGTAPPDPRRPEDR